MMPAIVLWPMAAVFGLVSFSEFYKRSASRASQKGNVEGER